MEAVLGMEAVLRIEVVLRIEAVSGQVFVSDIRTIQ